MEREKKSWVSVRTSGMMQTRCLMDLAIEFVSR